MAKKHCGGGRAFIREKAGKVILTYVSDDEELESLASFLRIDGDLLCVAAETSRPLANTNSDRNEVRAWVGKLARKEKDALIVDLMVHSDHAPVMELLQRFLKDRSAEDATGTVPRRTVKQLLLGGSSLLRQACMFDICGRPTSISTRVLLWPRDPPCAPSS